MVWIVAIMLCGPVVEINYCIDRPALEIVEHLAARLPRGTGEHLPPDVARMLDVARVYAAVEAWPADHYYRLTVEMLQAPDLPLARRLTHCRKTLEVWAKDGCTVIRSRLDIGWGREGWLSERVLCKRLAPRVFECEQQKIREAGSK